MLQSLESQRVGHDLAIEQQQNKGYRQFLLSHLLCHLFFFFKYLFIWRHQDLVAACKLLIVAWGIQFPDQGSTLGPLYRERGVLATGPPGKSQGDFILTFHFEHFISLYVRNACSMMISVQGLLSPGTPEASLLMGGGKQQEESRINDQMRCKDCRMQRHHKGQLSGESQWVGASQLSTGGQGSLVYKMAFK